jgi:AcrR family transcriptional regulator
MERSERKALEIERAKAAIVDAAARVFGARGYHGSTMEDLAREAGYAVGSLYNYFGGKEELYWAVVETIDRTLREAGPVDGDEDAEFRERLDALLRRSFAAVEEFKGFFATFFLEVATFDVKLGSELGALKDRMIARTVGWFEELVRAGIERGEVRAVDTRDAAFFLMGVVTAAFGRWTLGDLPETFEDHIPRMLDLVYDGLAPGTTEAT